MGKPLASMEVEAEALSNWIKTNYLPKAKVATRTVSRRFALEFLRRVILLTPVDTGRARAGWSVAAKFLGMDGSMTRAIKDGAFDPKQGWRPGEASEGSEGGKVVLTLVNNVVYISDLEDGSSKQAPLGMLRVAARTITGNISDEMARIYSEMWNTGTPQFRARARAA